MTNEPATPSAIPGATTLSDLRNDQPTTFLEVASSGDDTAVILYTSGTTGKPKGAELTHLNMLLNARLSDTMYPKADRDVHLISLPLFHSFGQTVQMNAGIHNRATLVLLPRFSPDEALHQMEKENVTIFAGVPTMYWALLHYPGADHTARRSKPSFFSRKVQPSQKSNWWRGRNRTWPITSTHASSSSVRSCR
jgi:long-chain acyl-CoA synthetase